jgi:hypothetical protein
VSAKKGNRVDVERQEAEVYAVIDSRACAVLCINDRGSILRTDVDCVL